MANTTISALSSASTPLIGTEVLPIDQNGITRKVAVTDLTAGRSVSAASVSATGAVSAASVSATDVTSTGTLTGATANFSGVVTSTSNMVAKRLYIQGGATSRIDIDSSGTGGTTGYDLLSIHSTNSVETLIGAFGAGSYGYCGTYSNHSFVFMTNNIEKMRITSTGNIYGTTGSTTMTTGFFYIPSAGGAPTGTPASISGRVPMYYDTTNNQFYVYNGAWKKVGLA